MYKELPMFDELMERKDQIRKNLLAVLRRKRLSVRAASQEIDISPVTLQRFIDARGEVHYVSLVKIEDFVEDNKEQSEDVE